MIEDLYLGDSWISLEFSTDGGLPVFVKFRPYLQNFIDTGFYNQRMDVIWSYNSPDETLLPHETDLDLMEQVEEALTDIMEEDNQTILAFSFTGENERWWAWYTTDVDIAGERLNAALAGFDELPITITANTDPDWDDYNGVLEDFAE
jgi:hypothetical protein